MACIAIMLSSLMPMISHAVQSHRSSAELLHEICTAAGIKTIEVSVVDDGTKSPEKHQSHVNDCPYCRLQSHSPALPPVQQDIFLPMEGAATHPLLFYQSPHRLFAWISANPRAPPLFS